MENYKVLKEREKLLSTILAQIAPKDTEVHIHKESMSKKKIIVVVCVHVILL